LIKQRVSIESEEFDFDEQLLSSGFFDSDQDRCSTKTKFKNKKGPSDQKPTSKLISYEQQPSSNQVKFLSNNNNEAILAAGC